MRTGILSGQWIGRYALPGGGAVPFDAMLLHEGAALTGTLREPDTVTATKGELTAVIDGGVTGDAVRFTKAYDFEEGDDPVHLGRMLDGGRRIAGEWHFPSAPRWRGGFVMMRCAIAEVRRRQLAMAGSLVRGG